MSVRVIPALPVSALTRRMLMTQIGIHNQAMQEIIKDAAVIEGIDLTLYASIDLTTDPPHWKPK